jgi:septal ring factor EnvC (AmiA/AmiB activator)
MDLNYLFLRQQVERIRAEAAKNAAARDAHEEMARQYELEIERKSGGRIAFPWHRKPDAVDPGSDRLISAIQTPSASS